MIELDQLLAEADYNTTYTKQLDIIKTEFLDACVISQDGGIFDITPEFLAGLDLRKSANKETFIWCIDRNQSLIKIQNIDLFISTALQKYSEAIEIYGNKWTELRLKTRRRSTKEIL